MTEYQIVMEDGQVVSVLSDSPHGAIKEAFELGMLYMLRGGMRTVTVVDMEVYLEFEIKVATP